MRLILLVVFLLLVKKKECFCFNFIYFDKQTLSAYSLTRPDRKKNNGSMNILGKKRRWAL